MMPGEKVSIPLRPLAQLIGDKVSVPSVEHRLTATPLISQAGGNDALALLLTITTNMLGLLTVPFMTKAVVSAGEASVNGLDLLIKLVS